LLLDGWQYASNNPRFYLVLPLPIRALLYTVLLYVTVAAAGVGSSEFIYFAF